MNRMRVLRTAVAVCAVVVSLSAGSSLWATGGDMGVGTDPLTDGSEAHPWLIEDFADFGVFANNANAAIYWAAGVHIRLECDLDLDPVLPGRVVYTTAVIAPDISKNMNYQGFSYHGYFNGGGHQIDHLTIDPLADVDTTNDGNDYLGLFGQSGIFAVIDCLALDHVAVTCGPGAQNMGSFCGENVGTIINCVATGTVTGNYSSCELGVLCGSNSGVIENCDVGSSTINVVSYTTGAGGICGGNTGVINGCQVACEIMGNGYMNVGLGGLCGSNNGTIKNSSVTGSIQSGNSGKWFGGLCGDNYYDAVIEDCYATVAVTCGSQVSRLGGLCGSNAGIINRCYATGDVTCNDNSDAVGGLCGDNYTTITNSYSKGAVSTGNNCTWIGGLCGSNLEEINNCYATGAIIVGDYCSYYGGLCGRFYSGTIENCYWDLDTSGMFLSSGGWGLSHVQTMQAANYPGWNNGHWTIQEDVDTPHLVWENQPGNLIATDWSARTYAGNGTVLEPYQIANIADLLCLGRWTPDWKCHFILTSDIDLSDVIFHAAVIARNSFFTGVFDGGGHTIRHLTISSPFQEYVGLFCRVGSGGEIRNINLQNVDVQGAGRTGGLCGLNDAGNIHHCNITGNIVAEGYKIGGLCGENSGEVSGCNTNVMVSSWWEVGGICGSNSGNLNHCFASGKVSARYDHVGGLCGYNRGSISRCCTKESVSGRSYIGGLCGLNSEGSIVQSCSYSQVTGNEKVGGFCGMNSMGGNISQCYAAGLVTGNTLVGSFCGYQLKNETMMENSFWDVNASGLTVGYNLDVANPGTINNVIGKTTVEMQTMSTFTDAGWDFVGDDGDPAEWKMREKPYYPILAWQRDVYGDVAFDGVVNLSDVALMAGQWMLTAADSEYLERCDLLDDDVIDGGDLAVLAEYWLYPEIAGDFNDEGGVNLADFAILSAAWQAVPSDTYYLPVCNLDDAGTSEGIIDLADLIIFCEHWLEGAN